METDAGATAWILASSALVLFMTPGLALFYGGLVRSKNVLGTMMHSVVAMAVVSVVWLAAGYTLAFGPDVGSVIGGLDHLFLRGVGGGPAPLAPAIPHAAFVSFQLMFAIVTPALIAGAFAERVRFGGYVAFVALWSLLVYSPLAHWVWGGGFLGASGVGALDFAGGTVVHVSAGAAALAAALFVGKRRGVAPTSSVVPHHVPLVVLGAGILWFGWFGFNAGSALAADGIASTAFLATQLGAAGGMLGWLVPERRRHGRATAVGAATGAVAGLVAITPAAGFVAPLPALGIGLAGGAVAFLAVELKPRIGVDDALDAVGVHMIGGIVGALLTGLLASTAVNGLGADGSLVQLGRQAAAVGVALAFSFVATLAILKAIDVVVGFRIDEDAEEAGLDLSQHGEIAYALRERARAAGRVPEEMTDAELAALRERLVLEATARVLEAIDAEVLGEASERRRR